jgi:thiol-disulfide isomerase/thioredoxin
MKIRYIALIAIISLLSMGTITGCSTTSSTVETATKTNPCASKVNPCASKSQTASKTGGKALATKLQGKPVVVDIYASWCPSCKNIAPTISALKQEYASKANFVVFDVSDQATTEKSLAKAKELGLEEFFTKNKANTSLVAIMDPADSSILLEKQNNADAMTYKTVLDAFKAKKS